MKAHIWFVFTSALLVLGFLGCSDDDDDPPPPPPMPSIADINSSANPKSPVSMAIEINGSGFLNSPGLVRFTEGTADTDVVPLASAWSGTAIVAQVPATLTPGAVVQVTVVTDNGTSNVVDLEIVVVPNFGSSSSIDWSETLVPDLPSGRRGLKAAVVPYTSTAAWVYVTGGQTSATGAANTDTCWSLGLLITGGAFDTDNDWTVENALPANRAFHALVAAHCENSPVPSGTAWLYTIGGQAAATDAPGGTDTVYAASVNTADGSVGTWASAGTLPAARWGHSALVYRGTLYVIGGYDTAGDPVDTIYQAPINGDGSLGSFTTSSTTLTAATGSFASFAFGGNLYVIGGELASSTNPNAYAEVNDTRYSYRAPITAGSIGVFVSDRQLGNERKKHVLWNVYGSVLVAEGSEKGGDGSAVSADVQTDGSLTSWNGTTEPSNGPVDADVFNAAAVLSPIVPTSNGPRFLLMGGDDFSGVAQTTVWVNTAP